MMLWVSPVVLPDSPPFVLPTILSLALLSSFKTGLMGEWRRPVLISARRASFWPSQGR